MRKNQVIIRVGVLVSLLLSFYSCVEPEPLSDASYSEWLSGGSQTIFDNGAGAFSSVFPNLAEARAEVHEIGDIAFEQTFVTAPSPVNPGLGPIYNNVSCTSCHINDGRGKPPVGNEQISSLLIRLSIPGPTSMADQTRYPVLAASFSNAEFSVLPRRRWSRSYTRMFRTSLQTAKLTPFVRLHIHLKIPIRHCLLI